MVTFLFETILNSKYTDWMTAVGIIAIAMRLDESKQTIYISLISDVCGSESMSLAAARSETEIYRIC